MIYSKIKRIGIIAIMWIILFSITLIIMPSAFAETAKPMKANDNECIDGGFLDSKYESEFDDVVKQIYELREKGLSFDEIDKIIGLNLQKQNGALKSKGMSAADKFYDYAHLNKIEKKLFKNNRTKGLLCLANGKFALKYSQNLYKNKVLHNGNGDAFRHTLWNYGMAIDVGQKFAKKWADAHENGANGQPGIEKAMDLYNNNIGRNLAKTYPHTVRHSTFKKNSRAKVRAGKCRIIKKNKLVKSSKYGEK